ncbi:transposase [Streptobacillus felis]|uniref:Transposase n=1 Tax=Streptobacillus felis TaxID=1384509 RepID=A0A7Z0PEK7_9FUSO|nr:transposase [Streptobacillus felis]NYV27747.1 transposase [Streptobacillus felis]
MKTSTNYTTNYTTFSEIKQMKLFNAFYYQIEDGDPVLELINILEGLDLTEFKKLFQYKTKINPIRLLAVVIYAYSRKITSLREIETYCKENIKFKYLLDGAPRRILEKQNINTNSIYIDGTKLEAYANRYTFVWKKTIIKNREKNNVKIKELISEFNSYYDMNLINLEEIIDYLLSKNIEMVKGKGKRKSFEQKLLERSLSFFEKNEEYEKHLNIMGDRNSYSKTDNDATFMRMKDDYMNNGQLKPGYNLQIGVCSELIIGFKVFSNPTDINTLIPFLDLLIDKGYELNNIVADAGYESLVNYEYLEKNNLNSYIKPQNYEQSKSRTFKNDLNRIDNLVYYEEKNELSRKDGLIFEYIEDKKIKGINYKIFRNPETDKLVKFNFKFREYSKRSRENIDSKLGKKLRLNRSIQVEGAFAVIKENMKVRKLKVKGKRSVNRELTFIMMGYNFKTYMNKIKNNKKGEILHKIKELA